MTSFDGNSFLDENGITFKLSFNDINSNVEPNFTMHASVGDSMEIFLSAMNWNFFPFSSSRICVQSIF